MECKIEREIIIVFSLHHTEKDVYFKSFFTFES